MGRRIQPMGAAEAEGSTCRLNVHRFLPLTQAEGPGWRSCVWVQGCSRHCEGCFAPHTWSHEPRLLMRPEEVVAQTLKDERVEGITVLGGEPFEQPEPLATLLTLAWEARLSTVVFTGFTHKQLLDNDHPAIKEALSHIDVLIDGPYRQSERDLHRPLVGSANQRFLFLTKRYAMDDFPPNKVEVRIGKDGSIALNGMGPVETLVRLMKKL